MRKRGYGTYITARNRTRDQLYGGPHAETELGPYQCSRFGPDAETRLWPICYGAEPDP